MTDGNKIHIYYRLWNYFKFGNLDGFQKCLDEAVKEGFNPVETFDNTVTGKYANTMSVILDQIISNSHFEPTFDLFPFLDAALSYCKDIDSFVLIDNINKTLMKFVITLEGDVQKKCECIRLLVKHGAGVNAPTIPARWANTQPIIFAAEPEVVETLIALGADLSDSIVSTYVMNLYPSINSNEYKQAPKEAFGKRLKCLEILFRHIKDLKTAVPLHTACILAHQAQIRVNNRKSISPAVQEYNDLTNQYALKVLDMLLEAGVPVNERDKYGLEVMDFCYSLPLFRRLIELGCSVNTTDNNGNTILNRIAQEPEQFLQGEIDGFIEEYFRAGGDPNIGCPIYDAVVSVDIGLIKTLAAHGADLNVQKKLGGYSLGTWALSIRSRNADGHNNVLAVMETLDKSGADLSLVNKDGRTPLHVWASAVTQTYKNDNLQWDDIDHADYIAVLDILLKYNDINVRDTNGRTAASVLIENVNRKRIARLMPYLVDMFVRGADFTLKDNGGLSTLDRIPYKKYRKELERCIEQKQNSDRAVDGMIEAFER